MTPFNPIELESRCRVNVQISDTLSRAVKRGVVIVSAVLGVPACLTLIVFWVSLRDYYALHDAARDGDIRAIETILDRHPERIERRDRLKLTPLHEAAWNGQADALFVLIQRGADVNAKRDLVATGDGAWSALHIAANWGHVEAARVLIRAGAEINAKSLAGETAFDVALRTSHSEVGSLLQAHGGVRGRER